MAQRHVYLNHKSHPERAPASVGAWCVLALRSCPGSLAMKALEGIVEMILFAMMRSIVAMMLFTVRVAGMRINPLHAQACGHVRVCLLETRASAR